jgi:hypothetical protein
VQGALIRAETQLFRPWTQYTNEVVVHPYFVQNATMRRHQMPQSSGGAGCRQYQGSASHPELSQLALEGDYVHGGVSLMPWEYGIAHEPDFSRVTESPETYLPEATFLLRFLLFSRARHKSNAMKCFILLCALRDFSSLCWVHVCRACSCPRLILKSRFGGGESSQD